jgi:peptidoglycan/LPS O-acetylase OafA/YrhL
MLGAHSVGVADGGPGLPVTRWSTEGGDLRAPHFFGLHALQALPLLAWLLERRRRDSASRLVIAAAVGWIGLTLVALSQALRGQPLVAPDRATVIAALVVVIVSLAVAAVRNPFRAAASRTIAREAAAG